MKRELNTKSALLVVILYPIFAIAAGLVAAILFGKPRSAASDLIVEGVIGNGMYVMILASLVLLYISLRVFKDSRKDIFFERKPFDLSKTYYLIPLVEFGVAILALAFVDFSAYKLGVILQVILASIAIAVNEEIVTRGILLVGLRNSGVKEWAVFAITVVVFSLLHLVNLLGGANLTVLLITLAGGVIYYVTRRVFNNLLVPIGLHALYDTAFYLLTGIYAKGVSLPDQVLDVQFGSFLLLLAASILFIIFGRKLLKNETTGWL